MIQSSAAMTIQQSTSSPTLLWGTILASLTSLAIGYATWRFFLRITNQDGAGTHSKISKQQNMEKDEHLDLDPALEALFQRAAKDVSTVTTNASNGDKLLLYGLYKQATVGDACNSHKPSRLAMVESAKYNFWGKFDGMSTPEAMVHYIRAVKLLHEQQSAKGGSPGDNNNQVASFYTPIDNDDIVYSDDDGEDDDDENDSIEGKGRRERDIDDGFSNDGSGGMGLKPSTLNHGNNCNSSPITPTSTGTGQGGEKTVFDIVSARDMELLKNELRKHSENTTNINGEENNECSKSWANQRDDCGQTPLHFAADLGFADSVQLLLKWGADPNAADDDGISILQTSLMACSDDDESAISILRALLEAGGDSTQADSDGDTPYGIAAEEGRETILKLFDQYKR
jgi:diazepam-binding inhibitor (GABA receptor modulating acyl-CoA-binding protein)